MRHDISSFPDDSYVLVSTPGELSDSSLVGMGESLSDDDDDEEDAEL